MLTQGKAKLNSNQLHLRLKMANSKHIRLTNYWKNLITSAILYL